MSSSPSLSLIISVYNKPGVLRLVLAACFRQSFPDYEIIVADDGSGNSIRDVVRDARKLWDLSLIHVWHQDRGWRKNTILNHAIRAARSDYLVFIDGDCLPAHHFLLDHHEHREAGKVLLGRRVETSRRWSETLTVETVLSGEFERLGWPEIRDGVRGESLRVEDGIRIRSRKVRRLLKRNVTGMLGSNFSVDRDSLVAINGFDELYDGPGCGEDSDLQHRLALIGVTGKSLRNLAIQFHVWHPRTKPSDACWDRFEMVKKIGEARCEVGLQKVVAR